jgi:hypothetical protein
MQAGRDQFTLRALFIATFWIAACCASWVHLLEHSSLLPESMSAIEGAVGVVAFGGPYFALRALQGNNRIAIAVAAYLLVGTLVMYWKS